MACALPLLLGLTLTQGDPATLAADAKPKRPYLVDVDLSLRFMAHAREPETALLLEEVLGASLPLQWTSERLLLPRPRQVYPSLVVAAAGEAEPLPGLGLRLLVDSGELRRGASLEPPLSNRVTSDGGEVGAWFSSGAFVRELTVSFTGGWGSVELGRRLTSLGDGLVYEDFGTGASASVDLEDTASPVSRVDLLLFAVGHTFDALSTPSPMLTLRLSRSLSMFESVDLYGSAFFERSGVLRDVLTSVISERVIANNDGLLEQALLTQLFLVDRPSLGRVFYLGLTGNLLPADGLSLRASVAGELGRVTVTTATADRVLALAGWAATLDASYGLTSSLGVGATLLALSGDDPPRLTTSAPQRYRSFIAVAPYWAWTGLFFSGGLNQGLYPGRAAAAGVDGRGVTGAVARAEWSGDSLRATTSVALLWAPAGPLAPGLGGGGAFYGTETDLVVEWQPVNLVGIGVEGDLFWPGGFFAQNTRAYRALAQVRVHAGN